MRYLCLVWISLLPFAGSVALADVSATANVDAEKSASPSRSADIREGQRYNAAFRTGLMYTLVPGAGIEGNYFLNKNMQVGASINSGILNNVKGETNGNSNEVNDDDDDTKIVNLDKAHLRASSVEGHLRWFPLNSLYVVGGMSYRAVRSELQFSDAANSNDSINVKTNSRALCADAGIGNEWSWNSGFFIGAEWLGLSTALIAKSDTDTDTTGVPSDDAKDESKGGKRFAEQIGKGTSLRLAMLHMGWAF